MVSKREGDINEDRERTTIGDHSVPSFEVPFQRLERGLFHWITDNLSIV